MSDCTGDHPLQPTDAQHTVVRARRRIRYFLACSIATLANLLFIVFPSQTCLAETLTLHRNESHSLSLAGNNSSKKYSLLVSLRMPQLNQRHRVAISLKTHCGSLELKTLHAGDPDMYTVLQLASSCELVVNNLSRDSEPMLIQVNFGPVDTTAGESSLEAEPNNSWSEANAIRLGQTLYGTADDVDYLQNEKEGTTGLDWFKFTVPTNEKVLTFFRLDTMDPDVSANLRLWTLNAGRTLQPYIVGSDPMETIHDREEKLYTTHISRVLTEGEYFLEVNANHPAYVLRTTTHRTPPYTDPILSVEVGLAYLLGAGDSWLTHLPRGGDVYSRASTLHESAYRCTACHATIFPAEASLIGHRNGYAIEPKDAMQYMMDRLYNSLTPLYGDNGLYWQRYISVPLQSQGKGGAVLLDFEKQVSRIQSPVTDRFGYFLSSAWSQRSMLPADENNGVVPTENKFGLAWRDWRVLSELAARSGNESFLQASANIARIVTAPESQMSVKSIQDRIHNIYGLTLIDAHSNASEIQRDIERLIALQNSDGGWHEVDAVQGASSVYVTGQIVYTLMEAGESPNRTEIVKALEYLRNQQLEFGGWYQSTGHENFQTPMRETRFAVMALATAFPKGKARSSWDNRSVVPIEINESSGVSELITFLENQWESGHDVQNRATTLLEHVDPQVRAYAAMCLGRIGESTHIKPLVEKLNDPSKIVWRAAALALRRLGNKGQGLIELEAALRSPDPLTRRGASRVFAQHFYGMDRKYSIARRLIDLTRDEDTWTRLHALRALSHWFYSASDQQLQKTIVQTFLDCMATEKDTIVQKTLSEGLYGMLDENLGGGVSLHATLENLSPEIRQNILLAREEFEKEILLLPILASLTKASPEHRRLILQAFDGSFLRGRGYAKQPPNALDICNDREFGFLYQPTLDFLEEAFESVFDSTDRDCFVRGIELARFFELPSRTRSDKLRMAWLLALRSDEARIREAAALAVREMSFEDFLNEAKMSELIANLLTESESTAMPIVQALAANPERMRRAETISSLRNWLPHKNALLVLGPVFHKSVFSDEEVASILRRDFGNMTKLKRQLGIEVLLARPSLYNTPNPSDIAITLLHVALRETGYDTRLRCVEAIAGLDHEFEWRDELIIAVLSDESPVLRTLGVGMSKGLARLWTRSSAVEALKMLLIDENESIRESALEIVGETHLVKQVPSIIPRIAFMSKDEKLGRKSLDILRSHGIDLEKLVFEQQKPNHRWPSFNTFREKINPLFSQPGGDGISCIECHATHALLQINRVPSQAVADNRELLSNYRAALRVIDPAQPEGSLLLRKPTSSSSTTLAADAKHAGGVRWTTDSDAYRTCLEWIRGTASEWSCSTNVGATAVRPAVLACDGDIGTYWSAIPAKDTGTADFVVEVARARRVGGLLYIPRQDKSEARIQTYSISRSDDGQIWSEPIVQGTWPLTSEFQYVQFECEPSRYMRVAVRSSPDTIAEVSAAELRFEFAE